MEIARVFIGYDPREDDAYKVARHSIEARSSIPVLVTPIREQRLRMAGMYRRPYSITKNNGAVQRYDDLDGKPFSTDFSFTRFLVPAMQQWDGWAVFVDCDFLFLADIAELFAQRDETVAVKVVKRDYVPRESVKMDGQIQALYPRKNWSSLILWNCEYPVNKRLTPDVVNGQTGSWLHGFSWLMDDEIGSLDPAWNWLEGESSPDLAPKAVHYTRGGPWLDDYKTVAYADDWLAEARAAGL